MLFRSGPGMPCACYYVPTPRRRNLAKATTMATTKNPKAQAASPLPTVATTQAPTLAAVPATTQVVPAAYAGLPFAQLTKSQQAFALQRRRLCCPPSWRRWPLPLARCSTGCAAATTRRGGRSACRPCNKAPQQRPPWCKLAPAPSSWGMQWPASGWRLPRSSTNP